MLRQEAWKLEMMHDLDDMNGQLDRLLAGGAGGPLLGGLPFQVLF